MQSEKKLNVLLVTYNHEKFIKETLDSILMQKTEFDFNIIVADDKSTDDTVKIIKDIEKESKIPFVYLNSNENVGITKNYKRGFAACDAKYVAVMEGDDIWTSPYRLQRHVDFLELHQECTMSFNRYIVGDFENSKFHLQPFWAPEKEYQLITSRDLAKDNIIGNFSNCVYRKKELDKLPTKMFDLVSYDWFTNIMVGRYGMIAYLTENMNIYRIHSNGQWSGKSQEENLKNLIETIDEYDKFTKGMFHNEFMEHQERVRGQLRMLKPAEIVNSVQFEDNKRKLMRFKDWVPPFIIWFIKGILPYKIANKLK